MLILILLMAGAILIPLAMGSYYYMKNIGTCVTDHVKTKETPASFMITKKNRQEVQTEVKCAGFATAYVLRHLGQEVSGYEVYEQFKVKMDNGYVAPREILTYLEKHGIDAEICEGTVATLKKRISQGIPVIALILEAPESTYLHYVVVTGYDEAYFYLVDAMTYLVNEKNPNYNRKLTIPEFEELWQIQFPFVSNIYVVIR